MDGKFHLLETSQLLVYISDNESVGVHHSGYNGIASLIPKATGNNIFVPKDSGLNYEHSYISGLPQNMDQLFEPRLAPMEFGKTSSSHATLHQPPTDFKGIEAYITFRVEEPYYIHQTVKIIFHKKFDFPMAFDSVWASYLHMARDRHIYLRTNEAKGKLDGWIGLTQKRHGMKEFIVRSLPKKEISVGEHMKTMETAPVLEKYKYFNENLRFYYGLYFNYIFLMIFKEPERVHLAYSPCGGGKEHTWSPAWDYRLYLNKVEIGKAYTWNICLVFKPYKSRQDVLEEVNRYMNTKKNI